MFKRILTMMIAAMLLVGIMLPAVSLAEFRMYVYTSNGKGLNVRSAPNTGDNVIKSLPFGSEVNVAYHLGNGWSAIRWTGSEYDLVYVQTRFLVNDKPSKKPSSPTTPAGDSSTTVAELNKIFKTYKRVTTEYMVTVRPTRASGWVNLRFTPTKNAELMATYRDNDQLTVIAEFKDWYQVEDPKTGAVGYISAKFVVK